MADLNDVLQLPVLNEAQLCALREALGKDALAEMLELFCVEAHSELAGIRVAINVNDQRTVHHILHTLKGMAGNFGIERMGAVADFCYQASYEKPATIEILDVLSAVEIETLTALDAYAAAHTS